MHDQADGNEIGTTQPRGRPSVDRAEASDALSQLAGEAIEPSVRDRLERGLLPRSTL